MRSFGGMVFRVVAMEARSFCRSLDNSVSASLVPGYCPWFASSSFSGSEFIAARTRDHWASSLLFAFAIVCFECLTAFSITGRGVGTVRLRNRQEQVDVGLATAYLIINCLFCVNSSREILMLSVSCQGFWAMLRCCPVEQFATRPLRWAFQ